MVGVLAMAAAAAPPPVGDYDEVEACKKRREDDDTPSCRTIRKYLSPIGKTGDRVFSSSKPSNILDYFRKTSPTSEQTHPAKECKIKSHIPLPPDNGRNSETPLEMLSNREFKKRRKRVQVPNQQNHIKPENESPIEISSDDSKDVSLDHDFEKSSTSVLLSNEHVGEHSESVNEIPDQSSIITPRIPKKDNLKQGVTKRAHKKLRKRKCKDVIDLSENFSGVEELSLKKDGKDSKQVLLSTTNEIDSTANHVNSGDNFTEKAQCNERTITVSYEEFLKTQSEKQAEHVPNSTMSTCVPSDAMEDTVISSCTSDIEACEISQICSKTVTVLAQVHSFPPQKKRKIPSIFFKQKQLEMETSLSDPENEQTVQKRKSNVVIREEELELAVLEAGNAEAVKSKCTLEERQQFMKAFRQPGTDTLKNGGKKTDKQRELHEKSSGEDGRDHNSKKFMENPNVQVLSNNDNSHSDKGIFTKEKRKILKKKHKKMFDIATTPGENREEKPQKEETTFSFKDENNQNRLRMSLRKKKREVSPNSLSSVDEDKANYKSLKMTTLCSSKSLRRTSTPVKDKTIYSKFQPEDSLVNDFTPRSTRRSLRSSNTSAITGDINSQNEQDDSPVKVSTFKATSLLEKHSLYTAELITVSSDSESPIRMKFTRISTQKKSKKKSKKFEATDEDFTPQTRKVNTTSKNVSKAKQLIEKAKALHISRSKATEEIVTPLRRSSRHLPERKKSESDNSVIIIDSSPTSLKHPEGNQKKLQCLNDVLGKKRKMKVAPLFLNKKSQKTVDPDFGFDEHSQDKSEKSQDCSLQFKAKRDFLMSGLPELLKRQIAKKAAALDIYDAASTSFQKVVHVQQKDEHYLWHLEPPTCHLLTKFKEQDMKIIDISKCIIALGEFSALNSKSEYKKSTIELMGTRKDLTEEVKHFLLEEISWSNPEFPVKNYFPLLLKKRADHHVLSECHQKQESLHLETDVNKKETKRKRVGTECHKSKRRKPNEYSESSKKANRKPEDLDNTSSSAGTKSDSSKGLFSKTSRKKQMTSNIACKVETEAIEDSDILIIDDKDSISEEFSTSESGTEDMLWTEKYQPQTSSELIGNELAIKKLHSWLKDWKRRAELEERQNLKGKKEEKQEDLLDMDFKGSSEDEDTRLCNTMLITGPTGVGKTAAVYACAQELGFKIFEVNASSQRNGRQILSQLKEATQSHQVDKQGVNSQKPCIFNNYNLSKSPKKLNSPRKVVTSPRKLPPPSSPKSSGGKRALPPKTLANYFKVASKSKTNEEIGALLDKNKGIKNSFEQKQVFQTSSTNTTNSNVKEFGAEELNRKNATSLILFEEVDVIFEEDAGFLNAIKTFMATTKRPVILTTSDPTFKLIFDGYFEEINFSTPSLLNVASYLQMICLTENFRTDIKDFVTLLTANTGDIRKSIHYLQFWIRSGGGFLEERPLAICRGNTNMQLVCTDDDPFSKNNTKDSERISPELPKCTTGCAETLFGLKNIFPSSEDLFSFLKHTNRTKEEWHKLIQLLTEFQIQKVDFLYSNLEFILPLPVSIIPKSENLCDPSVNVDTSASTKSMKSLTRKHAEGTQPSKKSPKKKHKKKIITLDDSDLFDTQLDFLNESSSLTPDCNSEESKAQDEESNPETKKPNKCFEFNTESVPCPPKIAAEKRSSALVSQCLNSLTEFMDNMSFSDALLTDVREQKEFSKNDFSWTDGNVKSGLCDEVRLESNDRGTFQNSGELKAAVEALSFTKCSSTLSKALETLNTCKKLGGDPTKDLTIHVSQKHNNVYFSHSAANLESTWKRIAVIKSVFSSRSLLNLGNRQASITDYLPALRNICQIEKLKEQGKSKRRFLHYLEGIHLNISKETLNTLATGFP